MNRARTPEDRDNLPALVRFLLTTYCVGARMRIYTGTQHVLTIRLAAESTEGFEIAIEARPDFGAEHRFAGTLDECARCAAWEVLRSIGETSVVEVEVQGDVDPIKAEVPKLLLLSKSRSRVARAYARWRLRRFGLEA